MTLSAEFFSILWRVKRLLPTFVILSIVGCLIGKFFLRVPPDALAVTVAVPAVGLLAISRLLSIVLPRKVPAIDLADVPGPFIVLSTLMALTSIAALDMLLSAGALSALGLPGIALGACKLAIVFCLVFVVASIILACIAEVRRALTECSDLVIYIAWQLMLLPRRLANKLERAEHSVRVITSPR